MDQNTLQLLKKYEDRAEPQLFLSTLCQTPPENFHRKKKVTIDIVRNEPRIAVPLPRGFTGTRSVESTKFVNLEFEPLVYDTEVPIQAYNAFDRRAGLDPFDPQAGMLGHFVEEAMDEVRVLDAMTRRGCELQIAQGLTTGQIVARDAANVTIDTITFGAKGTHFVTPTAWSADGATGAPETDIEALSEVIARDGKRPADQLIFGRGAYLRFTANTKIRDNMNKWNMDYGQVARPQDRGGAKYHGSITIGTSNYEVWSYRDTYIDPNSGAQTPYIADNKVVVRAKAGRLDMTFGEIPLIVPPDARVKQFMPSRLSNPATGFDATINTWVTPNGKSLQLSVGTRALFIPTAVDTFGCLTVY